MAILALDVRRRCGSSAGDCFQIKRIVVKPGASLSLQMHRRRAEHWVVVRGIAKVTVGDEIVILSENQSTHIPIGALLTCRSLWRF